MIKVSASILAANILELGKEIEKMEKAGCDWIHLDVMDGSFVPNISYGPHVAKALRKNKELFLDVHLMINQPENHIKAFMDAGADLITIHCEATKNPQAVLETLRQAGIKTGITLKPKTAIEEIKPYLEMVDMVLVMTVEPGFGGQSFMADMLEKIKTLRTWGYKGYIQVDGGVDGLTGKKAVEAGADVLVMGTALFTAEDPKKLIDEFHHLRKS